MDREELNRERVRLLLDRYGILFRELLQREMPEFGWAKLFKSLYLMELSGEVLGGVFFTGIQGPQFISHKGFAHLAAGMDPDLVFWVNAADPASICGLGPPVKEISGLPRRLPGTHMVFHGPRLVLVSQGRGRDLTIHADPDDKHLGQYLAPLVHLMNRKFDPVTCIGVETINSRPAGQSPYADSLGRLFDVVRGHKKLDLFRKIR